MACFSTSLACFSAALLALQYPWGRYFFVDEGLELTWAGCLGRVAMGCNTARLVFLLFLLFLLFFGGMLAVVVAAIEALRPLGSEAILLRVLVRGAERKYAGMLEVGG